MACLPPESTSLGTKKRETTVTKRRDLASKKSQLRLCFPKARVSLLSSNKTYTAPCNLPKISKLFKEYLVLHIHDVYDDYCKNFYQ